MYETVAAGVTDQPLFLNAAVLATCRLEPMELLRVLKDAEVAAGRQLVGGQRWGPRPLDIDIIFYGGQRLQLDHLQVPHPR